MSRWLNKEEDIRPESVKMRKWLDTEKGQEYKDKHKAYMKEWRAKNKEKKSEIQKRSYRKIRLEVLQHYSQSEIPLCKCCKENKFEFLQIDHINNDGAEHRREIGMTQSTQDQMQREGRKPSIGGNGFVYWLKKNNYPEGFQVLCANCNYGKKNCGVCPHKLEN